MFKFRFNYWLQTGIMYSDSGLIPVVPNSGSITGHHTSDSYIITCCKLCSITGYHWHMYRINSYTKLHHYLQTMAKLHALESCVQILVQLLCNTHNYTSNPYTKIYQYLLQTRAFNALESCVQIQVQLLGIIRSP